MVRRTNKPRKNRDCDGKRRYPDRPSAEAAIRGLVRGGASAYRLHAYECGHCFAWHTGHTPRGKR